MEIGRSSFLRDLAIGGLLHDVGKVVQRAGGLSGSHMEIGGNWLEEDVGDFWGNYAWAAYYHHTSDRVSLKLENLDKPEKSLAAAIIAHADNLSASEREDITGDWNKDIPLRNIFDRVKLKDFPTKGEGEETFFPVAPLDEKVGAIYPEQKLKTGYSKEFNYTAIEEGLKNHLESKKKKLEEEEHIEGWLLRVLERYTAFVPSDTSTGKGRFPDISLYDHLRTTAMIAVCLGDVVMENERDLLGTNKPMYTYKELEKRLTKGKPFLLVEGAIRGIQSYIYDIGSKKALQGLRARSFYLELLQERIVFEILNELELPRTQVLYVGGGRFILILPNIELVKDKLREYRIELNKRFFNNEEARLSMELLWEPFSWHELKESKLNKVFERIGRKREISKTRPMLDILENVLGSRNDSDTGASCNICGRRVVELSPLEEDDNEVQVCSQCKSLIALGKRVVGKTKYVYFRKDNSNLKLFDFNVEVTGKVESVPHDADMVLVLRDHHSDLKKEDGRFIGMPYAGYAWDNEIEKVINDGALGAKKLGALRMDVDNLGKIFREGFVG
ncbi:MAG: type III-A CRISPR-associated protein Cas10/Csm1, partial [Thermotogaceae bacterium]|nr:type III-A CRISPR-associated protein Cas10/Csm1 [Thermotogaceae bacterium]